MLVYYQRELYISINEREPQPYKKEAENREPQPYNKRGKNAKSFGGSGS